MKHLSKILLFTLNFLFISAQNTVAVLDFEGIGVSKDEARALSNRFGTEFMSLSSGRFVLVERQQMGEILEEQGFQQSGCVSSECAVEVGAALGAKFIIIGSISKVGSLYSVNARFLDVETSEIIRSISHDQMGDIMTLMTRGMKESALKLLGQGTSSEPMVTTGSFTVIALETGITLHNVQNGEYIADAPTTTSEVAEDVQPGIYRFLAKKSGYQDQIFEVEVFAGRESNLTITGLKRLMGTFTLNIYTDSSLIFINDEFIDMAGVGPYKLNPSPYGSYNVKVEKEGYEPFFSVERLSLPDQEIYVELVRTFPSVTITSSPSGSILSFNNKTYTDFTTRKFKVEPGSYPIQISKDGYISQTNNVYLAYGDNKEVKLSLVPKIANIHFNVNVDKYILMENKKNLMGRLNDDTLSDVPFGYYNYLFTAIKYEPLEVGINVGNVGTINQNVSLVRKSPQKAFRKSLLLPGTGQFYAENKGKGILMMGLHLGSGFLAYSNYTKYNDSIALKDEYYLKYKSATDLNSIATNHAEYERNVKAANDAAGMVMTFGATFVINWAFSAVDALLFSGL